MAVTPYPVFAQAGNYTVGNTILTQNTAMDGTGTVVTVLTGGTNGTLVFGIRFRATGSAIQSVIRIFLNNGSSNATAGNNSLIDEINLPPVTGVANAPTALVEWVPPRGFVLQSGHKINITIGTTVANAYSAFGYGQDL